MTTGLGIISLPEVDLKVPQLHSTDALLQDKIDSMGYQELMLGKQWSSKDAERHNILQTVDPDRLTPREALDLVYQLTEIARS